jgi:hypothetical protein
MQPPQPRLVAQLALAVRLELRLELPHRHSKQVLGDLLHCRHRKEVGREDQLRCTLQLVQLGRESANDCNLYEYEMWNAFCAKRGGKNLNLETNLKW